MSDAVSDRERAAFFRDVLGVTDLSKPISERRQAAWHTSSLDGRPVRTAEYRAAHLALPPGPKRLSPAELDAYFAKQRARIKAEAGATSLDDLP